MDAPDSTLAEKYCARCEQTKPIFDFGIDRARKWGVKAYCKPCHNASNKATRAKHIDKHRAIEQAWRDANKEKIREKSKAWRVANKDHARELVYAWRDRNKEKVAEIQKRQNQKINATPEGRLRKRLSYGMRKVFDGKDKERGLFRYLGYTPQDLREHMERQFVKGMGWHNHDKWHIDHIIPLSSFKYESVHDEQFKQAWALSNLRPLWARDNLTKYNKRHFLL